jgi:hypothetical protein
MKNKKEFSDKAVDIINDNDMPRERGFDILFKDNQADQENSTVHEKTIEKALDELFSVDGIDLKSDINNRQISALTRGYIFADVYKCKYMGDLVRHILELSVSKSREGRKEFVRVLQSSNREDPQEPLKLVRRRLLE